MAHFTFDVRSCVGLSCTQFSVSTYLKSLQNYISAHKMSLLYARLLDEYIKAADAYRILIGGRICTWNKSSRKLRYHKTPYLFSAAVLVLFGITTAYQGLKLCICSSSLFGKKKWEEDYSCQDYRIAGVLIVAAVGGIMSYVIIHLAHQSTLEQFMNNIISMEKAIINSFTNPNSPEVRKVKNSRLICMVLRIIGIQCAALLYATVSSLLPFLPSNIFSHEPGYSMITIIPERFSIFKKIIIFFGNWIYWEVQLKVGFLTTIEVIIGSVCLTSLLLGFERKLLQHEGNQYLNYMVQRYMQIQVVTYLFNEIQKYQLVAILLPFGFAQVGLALALNKSDTPILGKVKGSFYVLECLNIMLLFNTTIVINLLFGCCAQVHDTSSKVLRKLFCNGSPRNVNKRSWNATWRSLKVVRVEFGTTNFIDKCTPVMYQSYLVQRIVDGMLLK